MSDLTFKMLRDANVRRCGDVFHPLADWSPTDWACAFAGEAGEACNEVKKLRRIVELPEDLRYATELRGDGEVALYQQRVQAVADELADAIIYADLLAARLGIDLGDAVVRKFNIVSERVQSGVSLPAAERSK